MSFLQLRQSLPAWLSPVFIAFCAGLMFIETCIVAGSGIPVPALAGVFTGALLAYSLSKLRVHLHFGSGTDPLISGPPVYMLIALACAVLLFPLATFMELSQALWLSAAAACSFLYMIPVYLRNGKVSGWRSIFLIKNLMLALVWTITTVIIPAGAGSGLFGDHEFWLIVARRFCFIYCLATLYDLPDTISDQRLRIDTIPAKLGKSTTLLLASIILGFFIVLTILDRHLSGGILLALLLSALFTGCIILFGNPSHHPIRYKLVVDSAMAFQALLVIAATV